MLERLTLTAVAALALSSAASAQGAQPSVFVDIGSLGYGSGVPSSTFAGAAPSAGSWNALDVDLVINPVYVTPPLVDTNGMTTGVTLEWDAQGIPPFAISFDEFNTTGDDEALLDDGGYANGLSTFTFSGLPTGSYDVITYAMAPDSSVYFTNVAVLGSLDPPQDVGGDFALGYMLGVTHARHTVFVAPGGMLTVSCDVAIDFDTINGIQVFPSSGTSGLGTSFCGPAATNSSGAPALMTLTGSPAVSMNALTLNCGSMPLNAFGFFLVSQTQGFVSNPGGSAGSLCLSGAIGRYVGAGQILNSGTAGSISLPVDLTMVPQPTGFVSVQAGETWNFTSWFRDAINGVATSNFAQGVELVFQ